MLKVDDILKAVVFATPPFGIYLRDVNHPTVDILVKITELSWAKEMSTSEYTQVGAVLEITILFIPDETLALATIIGEEIDKSAPNVDKYIVRIYDGMDFVWTDVSEPVTKKEADRIWSQKTDSGTKMTKFDDIDYYKVFPADTKMIFRDR